MEKGRLFFSDGAEDMFDLIEGYTKGIEKERLNRHLKDI